MIRRRLVHFWLDYLRSDVMSFSVHCIKGLMILICLITDDINLDLDHLVKAMCWVFIINKYFGRETLRSYKYPVSVQTSTH